MPSAKAISFTPEVLKAKLQALEQHGQVQTRRPMGWTLPGDPRDLPHARWGVIDGNFWFAGFRGPFGAPGQILWVRERAKVLERFGGTLHDDTTVSVSIEYALDGERRDVPWPMRLKEPVVGQCIPNGVHREGARHFLEVVEVRVERVTQIREEDCWLEGFAGGRPEFCRVWNSIYSARAHERDWCFVYTLKKAARP